MFVVVGSGPAGIACTKALLERGQAVTMVDAGITLEADREAAIAPLRHQVRAEWSPAAISVLRGHAKPTKSGLSQKLAYGSDFPYRLAERELHLERKGVICVPSFARGGMSNVWGGSMLSYRDDDIRDWPVGTKELAPHYRAVLSWLPHSAVSDRLEATFPTYSSSATAVPPSRQAQELLSDLEVSAAALEQRGVMFGRSRIAVDPACVRCGLCMYGCPKGLVFNSATVLADLLKHPGFSYRPGLIVDSVRETNGEVVILTRSLQGNAPETIRASRVFLGCGPLATTRIMLASMEAFDRELVLQDSQYYMFPMLRYRGTPRVATEPMHSLAQVFLEIFDPTISEYSVHMQVYSYNDLYDSVFERMLGPLRSLVPLAPFLGRLLVAQGYIHSSESPGIAVSLTRPNGANPSRMLARATTSPNAATRVHRIVRKMASLRRQTRMVPIAPLLKLGEAGAGYHVGGSFPMRAVPGSFESDTLGRPQGFDRVHLVDSTTFPTIPASTVTFTVLANAHRIGSAAVA